MINDLLLYICNKHSCMYYFCTCASTRKEYISQSRTAGFTECLICILWNIFEVSFQRNFLADIEWEDLYSHTLTNTQHLKKAFTFGILIGEIELMFSFSQFCCLMFIDCCRFFSEIACFCPFLICLFDFFLNTDLKVIFLKIKV